MKPGVLIVDDEEHVLQSLTRLLRRDGYEIHLAPDGAAALEILDKMDIAVIVCDQRMPGMSGAQVLAEAYKKRPDTVRITLTGYTDLTSAQASINEGRVHQFLLKPWDDDHLRTVVREGVRSHGLTAENRRLEAQVRQQNVELENWNKQLERQVQERTRDLEKRNQELLGLQRRIKQSLRDTVAVLVSVLEAASPALAIHSKRVADMARRLASQLQLPEQISFDVQVAAHLHEIGKLSLLGQDARAERRSAKPRSQARTEHYAETGYRILTRITGFEAVAQAVHHQHERYDGSGAPNGLQGDAIPIAARIIAVTNAFDEVAYRNTQPDEAAIADARRSLQEQCGRLFDPELVRELLAALEDADAVADGEAEISPSQITQGMILARDLVSIRGVLLLKAGTHLIPDIAERIRTWNDTYQLRDGLFVKWSPRMGDESEGHAPRADQPAEHSPRLDGRILVVDDSESVCNALQRELHQNHFEVVTTQTGEAALQLVAASAFDAVITDLWMPAMSGEEFINRLVVTAPDLPCILMTGNAEKDQIIKLLKRPNLAAILVKPWNHQKLIAAVQSALAGEKFVLRQKTT